MAERCLVQYNFYNWKDDVIADAHLWVELEDSKFTEEVIRKIVKAVHGDDFEHLEIVMSKGHFEDNDEWYECDNDAFSLDLHVVCSEKDIMLCGD